MKRITLVALLNLIAAAAFADSAELDMYTQLFNSADTAAEPHVVLRNAADAKIDGSGDFFAAALRQLLLKYPSITNINERDAADSSARIILNALGNEKYTDAGADMWRTVEVFSNPLIKADALIALGRVGAAAYLPQVIQTLTDLNTSAPPANDDLRIRGERAAYGAIISLENYKDPAGYLPVFFASTGWYSARVRNQASVSLPRIMEDPSEPLTTVIRGSGYPYAAKHLALRTVERSEIGEASKAAAAVAALEEGLRASTNDERFRRDLIDMRKLALNMIRRYRTEDAAVYPLLENSYNRGDTDERLAVVGALSALASDDAVRLLSSFLMNIHQRRQSDTLTVNDEQLVRVIIPALGAAKHTLGRPALQLIQQSPAWTNGIRNLAAQALREIAAR